MKLFGFSKKEHIRKRKDFLAVIASGQKLQTEHFIIYMKVNSQPFSRLGITVSHQGRESSAKESGKAFIAGVFSAAQKRLLSRARLGYYC
ncbi:MAG: Ribonuclease P protein component [Candidatus Methanoperedenaceae archaeon GB37]|nr:MAG: Ribonuclease P protein component [Candidatus Methanoperedenaceae archaeon GB37]